MTSAGRKGAGSRLHDALDASIRVRALAEKAGLAQCLAELEIWQKRRLATTYADLAASKKHRAATEFFTTDLYAPTDLDQRDVDVQRMYPLMVRLLPESAVATIATAIELQSLTLELDLDLVRVRDAGAGLDWSDSVYAGAYRESASWAGRERQIRLIVAVGQDLDHLVRNPLIRGALRVARGPAALAGLATLHSFLERGFAAFRAMRNADYFLETIEYREQQILDAIRSGSDNPFDRPAQV